MLEGPSISVAPKVNFSALFTFLVRWYAGAVSLTSKKVISEVKSEFQNQFNSCWKDHPFLLHPRFISQLSSLFWLGGMSVLLACPPGDVIFAQLACPLGDIMFCLCQE